MEGREIYDLEDCFGSKAEDGAWLVGGGGTSKGEGCRGYRGPEWKGGDRRGQAIKFLGAFPCTITSLIMTEGVHCSLVLGQEATGI